MIRSRHIHRILIGALVLLATVRGEPVVWLPEFMRDLPADYLERLRACLIAGTERMGRLNAGESQGKESIGWVRYGQPSLLLGRRADEINRFFESATSEFPPGVGKIQPFIFGKTTRCNIFLTPL